MAKQAIISKKKMLEGIAQAKSEDVVTLEHISALMSKEKLMCMSEQDMVIKYNYPKIYTNADTGYDSIYIYFKDSNRKQFSMSLSEMRNCYVKTSAQKAPVDMIDYLEEIFTDGKTFPAYMAVVATEVAEKAVFPLAYYKEYTRATWQTHRTVEKAKATENEEIRNSYILGKNIKPKYENNPFLKSITFEILD